jgi:predicted TIM-barrel fold metal-dependent hydrolase
MQRASIPSITVPPGAWDTHFHAAGDAHPGHGTLEDAEAMHRSIGIERGVLVEVGKPTPGHEALIAQLESNPRLRAVALIDDASSDAQLQALHEAGVRGVRFHFVSFFDRRPGPEMFRRTLQRVATLGWHVLLHVEPAQLLELGDVIEALPLPVVIDHSAHCKPAAGLQDAAFQKLLALHRLPHCWVKLSSADRWSEAGAPGYGDAVAPGRAVLHNAPERVLWATDWPHVLYKDPRKPGDPPPAARDLMNLLAQITDGDAALLRAVLVDNPLRLYA